jgi:hypothetical protein
MDIQISEDILKQTEACKKNFVCLSGNGNNLCEVEGCIVDTIYSIKCLDDESCSYSIPHGSSNFCMCPVRQEIHKRYHI